MPAFSPCLSRLRQSDAAFLPAPVPPPPPSAAARGETHTPDACAKALPPERRIGKGMILSHWKPDDLKWRRPRRLYNTSSTSKAADQDVGTAALGCPAESRLGSVTTNAKLLG